MSIAPVGKDPVSEKRSTKKRLLLFAGIPAALIVLIAFLILGLPRRWEVPPMSRTEAVRLQLVIGKLAASMLTKDGKMASEANLVFFPSEIDVLLNSGLRAAQLRRTPELYYAAEWKQGAVRLRVSRILLFLAVNLETELIPAVRGGKTEVAVRSCRVGWIPLPPSLVENEIHRQIQVYEQTPEFAAVHEIIKELSVRDDCIHLRLCPEKISLLFPLLRNSFTGTN